jgi:hypothetical protein
MNKKEEGLEGNYGREGKKERKSRRGRERARGEKLDWFMLDVPPFSPYL